jgi:4-oxalocrotonate tautomerase
VPIGTEFLLSTAITFPGVVMPTFHIELFEGRSLDQKREFVEAITKATCESLGVEPNSVDIVLTEVKRENWATGGRLWSEA